MNQPAVQTLCRKLDERGFAPRHVAEVGVFRPENCNVHDYIQRGVCTTLVEPDPASIAAIRAAFGDLPHVTLHAVAVFDHSGEIELVQRAASTFARVLPQSPSLVNDAYEVRPEDTFTVAATTFDHIDDGTIDLLSIDIEGGEWFVIKHMASRPRVISLETHGAAYTNPYLPEIEVWMRRNGYRAFYRDNSDTVYVVGDFAVGLADRTRLAATTIRLAVRRFRKRLLNAIRTGRVRR